MLYTVSLLVVVLYTVSLLIVVLYTASLLVVVLYTASLLVAVLYTVSLFATFPGMNAPVDSVCVNASEVHPVNHRHLLPNS